MNAPLERGGEKEVLPESDKPLRSPQLELLD